MDPGPRQTRHEAKHHLPAAPSWVFLGVILVTALILLFPPDVGQIYSPDSLPPDALKPPALLPYPVGLPNVSARCPNKCQYEECVRWVPGPSEECPNPGKGGGCCLEYKTKCDPNCTESDRPPSISGNVTCGQSGQNGWCVNNAQLVLTATDPQGYAVTIGGDLNGAPFSCGASCTLDLPVGTGTAHYTATAATSGMSSPPDSKPWAYDPELPAPKINLSGTQGTNGWYISTVDVQATGTDAISGIAGASISVDGGAERSSATLSDGVHTVKAIAIDNAGNISDPKYVTIPIDATNPVLDMSAAGAPGANGWYVSNVQASASASDVTSGINAFEVTVDGGPWTDYTSPITFSDGQHTVQFKATDNASNVTTSPLQTHKIDIVAPVITPTVTGTTGTDGWYTSAVQVSATATDTTSGMDAFEASVDGGLWTTYGAPLSLSNGRHSVQFRAADAAGNSSQVTQSVSVDTAGPVIDLPASWTLGRTIEYRVTDAQSGLASVRVVIEDQNERYAKVAWNEDVSGASFDGEIDWNGKFKDGTVAPPGTYLAWVKAWDKAGNETMKLGKVNVPAPFFSFFLPPPVVPSATPSPTAVPTATAKPTATKQAALPVLLPAKQAIVVTSFSAGGVGNSQPAPNPIQTNLPLVSAAIAAMTAAAYTASQKQTAQAESQKDDKPSHMSYRQIAKAYAAAKSNFNAALKNTQAEGLSDAEAQRLKAQVKQTGRIGGALASLNNQVNQIREKKTQNQFDNWLRPGKNPPPGMQDVTEAGRLAAYQQTDQYKSYAASMQAWEQQKAYDNYRKGEREPESVDVPSLGASKVEPQNAKPATTQTKTNSSFGSWLQDKVTQLAFANPIVQWGEKNKTVARTLVSIYTPIADSLQSIGDPNRNPRMAAGSQQMWDGINAWQGILGMRDDAQKYTVEAVKEGRWSDAWNGAKALVKQNLEMAKYTAIATGMTVWGIVTTPVRIFTHDIPEFYNAGKERAEGKDRFWDVLLTGTNLAGDVSATYAMAKPFGLVDAVNTKLSKFFSESPVSTQFGDVYTGVRQVSSYLQESGVPRAFRKQILSSFNTETIRVRVAGPSEYGIRYYDNVNAYPKGRYLFDTFPASRASLAMDPTWNQMTNFRQWQIRPGTVIIEGEATSQGSYLPGGQIQKFILSLEDLIP